MDVEALARTYGYPVVLLGTALQGEAVLLVCGFLAQQGYLSVWIVWLMAALGGTTGDQTYFFLGRAYGERLIDRLPGVLRGGLHAARRLVDRHPRKVLLYTRFLFGMRIMLPILAGTSPTIPSARWVRYNSVASLIWAGIFVWIGYAYGEAAERVLEQLEGTQYLLILILALAGLLYHWAGRHLHGHERLQRDDDA